MAIRRTTFCLLPGLAFAAPTAQAVEVLSAARIGQTLAVLAAIVACIFGLAYLVRRVPGFAARAGGALKLIDALSIGARERILLIEVDGERLVLAVSPGRIERLHVLMKQPVAPTFTAALAEAGASRSAAS